MIIFYIYSEIIYDIAYLRLLTLSHINKSASDDYENIKEKYGKSVLSLYMTVLLLKRVENIVTRGGNRSF